MLATASIVRAGRLRALAVTQAKRTPGMPDIPTMKEAGVANYVVEQWAGMIAPRGVQKDRIALMNREINRVLELPATKKFFEAGGSDAEGGTPAELDKFIKAEISKWTKVIKESNLRTNR